MKSKALLMTSALALPFVLGGCLVHDDTPDVVPGPSSTTVVHDNPPPSPTIHVNPAPNVTINKESPPPKVDVHVNNPPSGESTTTTTGN